MKKTHERFNSTLFSGLPEESLVVSETERAANESIPLLPESHLLQSNVTNTRERNLLNEIDQVLGRVKGKAPAFPAEALKQIVEKNEELAARSVNQIVNRRPSPKVK